MKMTTSKVIKAFMIPLVALMLVLPLAMASVPAAASPILQEATATTATGTTADTPVTTDATVQPTAVVGTTNQGNDFPWWLLLIPLAALLLIPLFMRRPQTEVVTTRTTEVPPTRPTPTDTTTTTTGTTTRTTVTPTRTDHDTEDHTHS